MNERDRIINATIINNDVNDVLYDTITNYGITIDNDGDLCLVDGNNNRVKLCDKQEILQSFRYIH